MNYYKEILKEVLKFAPIVLIFIFNNCKKKKEKPEENFTNQF